MLRVRVYFFGALLFLILPNSWAALRLGLGNAVAKRSADLINQAGATSSPVGDSVAATLPSCPAGAIYNSPPMDLSGIVAIDPLGHVAPSGHTLPSDHVYLYRSTMTTDALPIYAPGAIHVTDVASTEYLSASPVFSDYAIYFYGCREVDSYYGHVRTLSPNFQNRLGTINQNCSTYSTGGTTVRRCDQFVDIPMASGDVLGYTAPTGALDFGAHDTRIAPLAFISPSRHVGNQPYTVCPIDYFSDGLKASMQSLLGRFDGGFPRVTAPQCGQINFDIAGTARGDWYHPGSPDNPEDPHLALILNNVSAPQETISFGTSLPNASPNIFTFTPTSSGLVDRDFSQVTTDGQIYCYDTFFDPVGQPASSAPIFLVQMLSQTIIKVEIQNPTSCGSGPWNFTSNAVNFER